MVVEHEVQGAVVLVTGGGHGLGAATAEQFLLEGAKHITILDVSTENGNKIAEKLNTTFGAGSCQFIKCDVTEDKQLLEAFNKVVETQGRLDVVVNNAGIINESKTDFKKMIDINVTALVSSTLTAIEMWRVDKGGAGGTVINIASEVAIKKDHLLPIYGTTKAAVLHFSSCISMEPRFSATRVRVMAMCPGVSNTALFEGVHNKTFDELSMKVFKDFRVESVGQSPTLVAQGVVGLYRRGETGSAWLVTDGKPARDVTEQVNQRFFEGAYDPVDVGNTK